MERGFLEMMRGLMGHSSADDDPADERGQGSEREQILSAHQARLARMQEQISRANAHINLPTWSHNVKPRSRQTPVLSRCSSITVSELSVNTVHTGRVLQGRLIVEPVMATSVMTVLEDQDGEVVMVSIYAMNAHNAAS